jgi:hypothetical protein
MEIYYNFCYYMGFIDSYQDYTYFDLCRWIFLVIFYVTFFIIKLIYFLLSIFIIIILLNELFGLPLKEKTLRSIFIVYIACLIVCIITCIIVCILIYMGMLVLLFIWIR